jgi:hypothetical protein
MDPQKVESVDQLADLWWIAALKSSGRAYLPRIQTDARDAVSWFATVQRSDPRTLALYARKWSGPTGSAHHRADPKRQRLVTTPRLIG